MQKIKQDTISIASVDIMDVKTLTVTTSARVYANNESEAQKIALDDYLSTIPQEKRKAEKSRVFARVDGDIEKYRLTCKMEDFINLCFEHGTAEKIEG